MCAGFGNRFVKWFCTGTGGAPVYRLLARVLQALVRRAAALPVPESVSLGNLAPIVEYLDACGQRGWRPAVSTAPSTAVRIALAARARGYALGHVAFLLGAEPLTAARRASIEATGARATTTYGFSEGGNVGNQCRRAATADDVHVSLDAYAVVAGRGETATTGEPVPLLLTALRPATPKVLLNAEIGDAAVIESRGCACRFGALGYHQHLHTIRSVAKLTGEGVTFRAGDVYQLLECALPARFGGSVADYQLVEEQRANGLPSYRLLVSPDVGPLDEPAVVATFLRELRALRRAYPFMVGQWVATGAVRVERRRPLTTSRGKVLPVRTLRGGGSCM
jgi:hypothetical protein